MYMEIFILAGLAAWSFDDWCPTPPRPPWPGPWPWPWFRKLFAVIGGIGAVMFFRGHLNTDGVDIVPTILLGGTGGVFLASLGSSLQGLRSGQA